MKVRSIVIAVVLFAGLFAGSCFAADIDGKWAGTMTTPNGDAPMGFNFKADGAALTGTTAGPDGNELKIANGKVDGNNISFSVTIDFSGMPLTVNFKGVVAKGEIKLTIDFAGMPMEVTVKKAA